MPMKKGQKAKKTLIAEAVQTHAIEMFKQHMVENTEDVLTALLKKAKEGDTSAIKIWMDRVMPASKAIDADVGNGQLNIQINVGKLERAPETIEVKETLDEDGSTNESKN